MVLSTSSQCSGNSCTRGQTVPHHRAALLGPMSWPWIFLSPSSPPMHTGRPVSCQHSPEPESFALLQERAFCRSLPSQRFSCTRCQLLGDRSRFVLSFHISVLCSCGREGLAGGPNKATHLCQAFMLHVLFILLSLSFLMGEVQHGRLVPGGIRNPVQPKHKCFGFGKLCFNYYKNGCS